VLFFVSLLVDGALAGAIYALIALAFVVVYKASRMVNFALGEWAILGTRLVATGLYVVGLELPGSVGMACAAIIGLAIAFNRLVLSHLVGRPLVSVIMVTLGLGAVLRGAIPLVFGGIPGAVPLPISPAPLVVYGVLVSTEKLVTAAIATAAIAALTWFFRRTRTGLALKAIADDQQAAMAMGIDVHRHFSIAWAIMGVLSVVAGTLWTFAFGGGFGVVLIGLKVFPIVIIGGLDSIAGALVSAMAIGMLESLAAGYLDPVAGAGLSSISPYFVLLAMLSVRPHGMFGRPAVERV
jgi:branched-chain amino acid transport system permease protein